MVDEPTRHIVETYFAATAEELAAGRTWYADAREFARTIAGSVRTTTRTVAGVIAALSPLMPWERNKELTVRAFADGHASGSLGNSVRAADRIMAGEDPLMVLKSDKVRNFFLAILGEPTAVCIDRHAWEVYEGKRYADSERPRVTTKRYREAADAYREAAHTLAMTPAELQAITWLVWRRIHLTGTRYERFL